MKKIYYLSTCTTCQKILSQIENLSQFELQDIKTNKITDEQLSEMKDLAGNYGNFFSKRAQKYRTMGLHKKELGEKEMGELILKEYTFLKRPVIIIEDDIYIGNAKNVIARLMNKL